MINKKKVLAFIGARSGSKGLIDKNIRQFHGKPLIAWTIEAALSSTYIDEVLVSTDSEEYLSIAKKWGAKVLLRPSTLSGDDDALIDALTHGYKHALNEYGKYDIVINLQPTSPLRTSVHIDEALRLFSLNENTQVFSCCKVKAKYQWIMKCNNQGYADFIDPVQQSKNKHARQNNEDIILPNGAIFILSTNDLSQFYNQRTIPYLMDENCSIDIDTQEDFEQASNLFSELN
jgi:CMP-N-acetylneuraminic acid synthetase